ncbi:MAG: elongation factor P [Bacteroidetes bacterium]|nr:MAG: elongation factor P [Bacteroidota bacterium]
MASTSDFFPGMAIKMDGNIWTVVEFQHVNPGNWRAFVRAKLKNIKSGKVVEIRFRAGEAVDQVRVENKEYQFLYSDPSGYVFMDQETYDQITVDEKLMGEAAKFLKEGEVVQMLTNASDVLSVEVPITVVLKVIETPPGIRGDTATGAQKPAKVETGATVNVPLFINEGDLLKIDTRTGYYLERVKNN